MPLSECETGYPWERGARAPVALDVPIGCFSLRSRSKFGFRSATVPCQPNPLDASLYANMCEGAAKLEAGASRRSKSHAAWRSKRNTNENYSEGPFSKNANLISHFGQFFRALCCSRSALVLSTVLVLSAFGAVHAAEDPAPQDIQNFAEDASSIDNALSLTGLEKESSQAAPGAYQSELKSEPFAGTPITMHLRLKDLEIAEVDLGANTFEAHFELLMSWRDPPASEDSPIEPFTPKIVFANAEAELSNTIFGVSRLEDGAISVWSSHRIVFSAPLQARHYPFDTQVLPVTVLIDADTDRPVDYDFRRVENEADDAHHDWKIASLDSATIPFGFHSEGFGVQSSALKLSIEAQRSYLKPFLLVFLPIAGAALISITTFGLPAGDTASRQGMSTTALLLAIAFTFTLYDLISFDTELGLSRITVFFLVCMAIPLIAFFFSLLHLSIRTAMGEDRVSVIESTLFWSSLAAIAATYFFTWNCGTFLSPPTCLQ